MNGVILAGGKRNMSISGIVLSISHVRGELIFGGKIILDKGDRYEDLQR